MALKWLFVFFVLILLSPLYSETLPPTVIPTNAPSISPTQPSESPTGTPTNAPSQSPTRFPTYSGNIYSSRIDIEYILQGLSESNNNAILNSSNHNIPLMQAIIESNYYDSTSLNSYQSFMVVIKLINSYSSHKLSLKSVIEFEDKYASYILAQSQSESFYKDNSLSFRTFFNNSFINFTVANASSLYVVYDHWEHQVDYLFWIINILLLFGIILSISAKVNNIYLCCVNIDTAIWLSPLLYSLNVYYLIINIDISVMLFYSSNEGGIACGVLFLIFLIIPCVYHVWYAIQINQSMKHSSDVMRSEWFDQYQNTFISLVFVSGDYYNTLKLISSNIFDIGFLSSTLSSIEINKWLLPICMIRAIQYTLQFIIIIISCIILNAITNIALNLFIILIILSICSLFEYFVKKDKAGVADDVFYYFNVGLKDKDGIISKNEREHIKYQKGLKLRLKNNILRVYYGVDVFNSNNFEIGSIFIRNNCFIIPIIHRIHANDLSLAEREEFENIDNDNNELFGVFRTHCSNLYAINKDDINKLIFDNYFELEMLKWDIKYCREYPINKLSILKGKNNSLRDLIRNQDTFNKLIDIDKADDDNSNNNNELVSQHRKQFRSGFEILLSKISLKKKNDIISRKQYNNYKQILLLKNLNHLVIDDIMYFIRISGLLKCDNICDSDIESSDQSMTSMFNDINNNNNNNYNNNPQILLTKYRHQFKESFEIIRNCIKNLAKDTIIGTQEINAFIKKLKENNIIDYVIEDMLHFYTECGLFRDKDNENDSDIDSSESDNSNTYTETVDIAQFM